MLILVSILIFIIAVLLVLVILVQNPKGGLASNFSSSNQVMGVRKTTDFLEKATWSLGIALLVFSVVSSSLITTGEIEAVGNESELTEEANQIVIPQSQAPIVGDGAAPASNNTNSEEPAE